MSRIIYFACLFTLVLFEGISQELVFENPVLLGPQINSEAEELNPILSPDGRMLYFVRAFFNQNTGGDLAGMDIWMSEKGPDGEWKRATNNFPRWNNKENNAVVGLNKDNKAAYLLNAYKKRNGIAFSKKLNNEWTFPEIVAIPGTETQEFVGYYMNPSFDILLISMNGKGSLGEEDLYVSLKDSLGGWSKPLNLGPTINTAGFEISPFLSPDGKRLYFSSNGRDGYGNADIFISDRLYNSWETWTAPQNLGSQVNSKNFDAFFTVYGDSVAFFSSNRTGTFADLYSVKVSIADPRLLRRTFLSNEEMETLFGPAVKAEIRFDKSTVRLNGPQNELLFYFNNKIVTKTDIKVQLTIDEEESPEITSQRATAVAEKLKSMGISSYRIDFVINKEDKLKTLGRGVLRLDFYK